MDEMDQSSESASEAALAEIYRLSLPTEDASIPKPVVILVVANRTDDTVGLVDFLKSLKNDGDWGHHHTAAGLRIHVHDCKSLVIVDTIPLRHMCGGRRSSADIARRWISRNGLRRIIFGKRVVVVCVVDCSLVNTRKSIFSTEREGWMGVFSLIFKPMRKAVIILAKSVPKDKLFVEERKVLEENIIYCASDDDGHNKLRSLIEERVFPSSTTMEATVVRHPICPAVDNLPWEMRFIWGPERVILVGRTGSGKSTLAQMLTLGNLDPSNKSSNFMIGSDLTSKTPFPIKGTGRGWSVLDTPGFGEADSGTVSNKEAVKRVKKYVKMVEGNFAHYLYVVKGGRLDRLDKNIWKFLVRLFGENLKQHFTVVVSNANDEWIEKNRHDLRSIFHGCESFLSASFPPDRPETTSTSMERNKKINQEYQKMRNASLRKLEEHLADRKLTDKDFTYGQASKEHIRIEKGQAASDMILERSASTKFIHRATSYHHSLQVLTRRSVAHLTQLVTEWLEIDGRIVFPELGPL